MFESLDNFSSEKKKNEMLMKYNTEQETLTNSLIHQIEIEINHCQMRTKFTTENMKKRKKSVHFYCYLFGALMIRKTYEFVLKFKMRCRQNHITKGEMNDFKCNFCFAQ